MVAAPNPNPGAFLLARDGSRDRFGAAGVADRSTGTPMRPGLKFRAGSITKTFTATVVLQLVAERRPDSTTPCTPCCPTRSAPTTHCPARPSRSASCSITPAGCTTTSTGCFRFRALDQYWPRDQLIGIGLAQPRYFPVPGTRFRYSNTNYLLLDLIVERITDRDLRTNLERRVFAPLKLRDTAYPWPGPPSTEPMHTATRTSPLAAPTRRTPPGSDVTAISPSEAGASGALVTTAADVARFYRYLLQGRLLPPELLRQMLSDTVPTTGSAPPAVGYGWACYVYATDCGLAYGHGGSAPGYLTFALNSRDGRHQPVAHTNWNPLVDAGVDEDFWDAFPQGYCSRPR
ncbi:beta-lactamase family protein [Streptomyces tricolor]|nr:beta-lactamase family protein [Streptomyces tricolor]